MYLSPGRHPTLPTVLKRRQPFSLSLSWMIFFLLFYWRHAAQQQQQQLQPRGATIWRPSTGYFSVHVAKLLGEGRKEEEEVWAYSIEAIVAQGGWLLTSD